MRDLSLLIFYLVASVAPPVLVVISISSGNDENGRCYVCSSFWKTLSYRGSVDLPIIVHQDTAQLVLTVWLGALVAIGLPFVLLRRRYCLHERLHHVEELRRSNSENGCSTTTTLFRPCTSSLAKKLLFGSGLGVFLGGYAIGLVVFAVSHWLGSGGTGPHVESGGVRK